MNAILFLFSRKFVYSTRYVLLITGYDLKRKDLAERLYGVYIGIILAVWGLVMVAWAVTGVAQVLAQVTRSKNPGALLSDLLFYLMALGLALTPWLAQRTYDLYSFSLSDLDFLSTAPVRPPFVAVSWFFKSLATRFNGVFVLVCGLLAGAIGQITRQGDLAGLLTGLAASTAFLVVGWSLLWIMALLRYRPVPAFGAFQGYALSALGVGLLLALPVSRFIYWPAWFASSLVSEVYPSESGWLTIALAGLGVTALAGLVALGVIAAGTLMAPAFEEGRLGGQLRRAASLGSATAAEARVQIRLERRMARGQGIDASLASSGDSSGVLAALLLKERLRMSRLSLIQVVLTLVAPVLLGVIVAAMLVALPRITNRIEVLAPAAFFACFALIRSGVTILRGDFAHIDFFTAWPVSRLQLVGYDSIMGFVLPLLGGEIALIAAPAFAGWGYAVTWMLFWPFLVAACAAAAALDFLRLLRKWPATPETLPDVGPAAVILAGIVWLIVMWAVQNGATILSDNSVAFR